MDVSSLYGLAGVPVVVALVQALKSAISADDRVWPLATLAVALVFNVVLALAIGSPLGSAVFVGLITGLSASGLYSHATTLLGGGAPGPKGALLGPFVPSSSSPSSPSSPEGSPTLGGGS